MKAVTKDGGALEFASKRLKGDREILMQAVEKKGWVLCYASDELKADKELALKLQKQMVKFYTM